MEKIPTLLMLSDPSKVIYIRVTRGYRSEMGFLGEAKGYVLEDSPK
jgi:hypothetical protein